LGIRPFYYRDGRTDLHLGPELRQLLDTLAAWPEPNEGVLGEYLSSRLVDSRETLYRGILRLPPGHVLTVEDGRVCHDTAIVDVDPRREIRYRSDDEYAEHFPRFSRGGALSAPERHLSPCPERGARLVVDRWGRPPGRSRPAT